MYIYIYYIAYITVITYNGKNYCNMCFYFDQLYNWNTLLKLQFEYFFAFLSFKKVYIQDTFFVQFVLTENNTSLYYRLSKILICFDFK